MSKFKTATMVFKCPGPEMIGNPPIACTTRVVEAEDAADLVKSGEWYMSPWEAEAAGKSNAAERQRKESVDAVKAMKDPKQLADYATALGIAVKPDASFVTLQNQIISVLTPAS